MKASWGKVSGLDEPWYKPLRKDRHSTWLHADHPTDLKSARGINATKRVKRHELFCRGGTDKSESTFRYLSGKGHRTDRISRTKDDCGELWLPSWYYVYMSLFTDGKISPSFSLKNERITIGKSKVLLSCETENAKEYQGGSRIFTWRNAECLLSRSGLLRLYRSGDWLWKLFRAKETSDTWIRTWTHLIRFENLSLL